jgi:hypothetical protein
MPFMPTAPLNSPERGNFQMNAERFHKRSAFIRLSPRSCDCAYFRLHHTRMFPQPHPRGKAKEGEKL